MDILSSTVHNQTTDSSFCCIKQASFSLDDVPFYYSHRPTLLNGVSDQSLTLAIPIICYWSLSLFFHALDMSEWKWLDKYRIHESSEVKSRNRASRSDVVWAVLLQQVIQTALGVLWLEGSSHEQVNHAAKLIKITQSLEPLVRRVLDHELAVSFLRIHGARIAYFIYWWGVPMLQLMFSIFFIDTWQYFLHRLMHMNSYLYKKFHSVHHRLYVPYAFGALYNHPVEGFILDSMGAAFAEYLAGLSHRQAMVLFGLSTFKTVDDHCGYRLPFDPLQMFTANNADYHDIHHQTIGIKSNFSQPFFIHWDVLLGTRMTRKDIEFRKGKSQEKTE